MKKSISIVLVFVMSAMLLVGCGGSSGAAGTYKMTKAEMNGQEMDMDTLSETLGGQTMEATITLKDDGNAEMAVNVLGQEQSANGTWKEDGDKIVITANGEEQSMEYKDGKLYVDSGNGVKLILEK